MPARDFFYWAIGGGFLAVCGFFSYFLYQAGQTMKAVRGTVETVENTAKDMESVKNFVKSMVSGIASKLSDKPKVKGGEKHV